MRNRFRKKKSRVLVKILMYQYLTDKHRSEGLTWEYLLIVLRLRKRLLNLVIN